MKKKQVSYRIPVTLLDALEAKSTSEGLTVTELVIRGIEIVLRGPSEVRQVHDSSAQPVRQAQAEVVRVPQSELMPLDCCIQFEERLKQLEALNITKKLDSLEYRLDHLETKSSEYFDLELRRPTSGPVETWPIEKFKEMFKQGEPQNGETNADDDEDDSDDEDQEGPRLSGPGRPPLHKPSATKTKLDREGMLWLFSRVNERLEEAKQVQPSDSEEVLKATMFTEQMESFIQDALYQDRRDIANALRTWTINYWNSILAHFRYMEEENECADPVAVFIERKLISD